MYLAWDGVGLSDLVAPISSSDWNDRQLGEDDGTPNCGGYFLAALNAETDVTVVVPDSNKRLETGSLTGTRLLLNGHNFQHLVLKLGSQEKVDDLELFDRERVKIDLLQGSDLAVSH